VYRTRAVGFCGSKPIVETLPLALQKMQAKKPRPCKRVR
jgi:hypothetical protein